MDTERLRKRSEKPQETVTSHTDVLVREHLQIDPLIEGTDSPYFVSGTLLDSSQTSSAERGAVIAPTAEMKK